MEDYQEYLKAPWCPLFGQLPARHNEINHPINKCIEVIEKTRVLWDLPFLGLDFNTDFPDPKVIEEDIDYPHQAVELARELFRTTRCVDQYARRYPPQELVAQFGADTHFDLNYVPEIAVDLAKSLSFVKVDDHVPD